mmetsp:Transcript_123141/g.275044  ORF Transcript_123141/g.275044 Transcript_123141/m.275044 type:complete len:283 (-) Transcript_123141:187-1035(-)
MSQTDRSGPRPTPPDKPEGVTVHPFATLGDHVVATRVLAECPEAEDLHGMLRRRRVVRQPLQDFLGSVIRLLPPLPDLQTLMQECPLSLGDTPLLSLALPLRQSFVQGSGVVSAHIPAPRLELEMEDALQRHAFHLLAHLLSQRFLELDAGLHALPNQAPDFKEGVLAFPGLFQDLGLARLHDEAAEGQRRLAIASAAPTDTTWQRPDLYSGCTRLATSRPLALGRSAAPLLRLQRWGGHWHKRRRSGWQFLQELLELGELRRVASASPPEIFLVVEMARAQ